MRIQPFLRAAYINNKDYNTTLNMVITKRSTIQFFISYLVKLFQKTISLFPFYFVTSHLSYHFVIIYHVLIHS